LWLIIGLVSGCVSAPPRPLELSTAAADTAADIALTMVGKPYQYRGESPEGFDCSGLVRYSYLAAGVNLPHGTGPLKQRTVPVLSRDMRRGDLLFFLQSGRNPAANRFMHAPKRQQACARGNLDLTPTGKNTSSAPAAYPVRRRSGELDGSLAVAGHGRQRYYSGGVVQ
jgi:cell wall-associated NlpC family hydrolase